MEVSPSCCSFGRAATVDEPDLCASDRGGTLTACRKKGFEKSPDYARELLILNTKAQSMGSWVGGFWFN